MKSRKRPGILMCLLTIGIIPLLVCGRSEAKPASGYRVPLEEIAEKIEYEYIYENMIDHIADKHLCKM